MRLIMPIDKISIARATEEREGKGIDSRLGKTEVCFYQ